MKNALGSSDNPFSAFAQSQNRSRKSLISAIRLLVAAMVGFVVVAVGNVWWQQQRVDSLIDGFPLQSHDEKLRRLDQLTENRTQSVGALVAAIADTDDEVSERAFEVLCEMRKGWPALPDQDVVEQRSELADALAVSIARLTGTPQRMQAQRMRTLAHLLAEDILASSSQIDPATETPQAEVTQAYYTAVDVATPKAQVNQNRQPELHQPATEVNRAIIVPVNRWREPLPIHAVERSGFRADEQPSNEKTLTPQLYRRTVATVSESSKHANVLAQIGAGADELMDAPQNVSLTVEETELIKPMKQLVETFAPQDTVSVTHEGDSSSYWLAQLASESKFVRLRAVSELTKHMNDEIESELRAYLPDENDTIVAYRIRRAVSDYRAAQ